MKLKRAAQWINKLIEEMKKETTGPFADLEYKDKIYEALNCAIYALDCAVYVLNSIPPKINSDDVMDSVKKALYDIYGKPKTLDEVKKEMGDSCEVMTSEEFKKCVECGGFIPWDGDGQYHNGIKETDINVWDDDDKINTCFPYVCWYNRQEVQHVICGQKNDH